MSVSLSAFPRFLPGCWLGCCWLQRREKSPDIAVVCVSVSVLSKGISQLILLLTLCACWALADRPTASLFIYLWGGICPHAENGNFCQKCMIMCLIDSAIVNSARFKILMRLDICCMEDLMWSSSSMKQHSNSKNCAELWCHRRNLYLSV